MLPCHYHDLCGDGWTQVPGMQGIDRTVWISDTSPSAVFVGGFFGVRRSDDDGIGFDTATGGTLLRSDDDGITWSRVEEFDADQVETIVVDHRQGIRTLAGTANRGVLTSDDDGTSWQPLNEGLISARMYSLALDPRDPERIWAGTGLGAHVYGDADPGEPSLCATLGNVLCLLDRFRVEVSWTDFTGRSGQGTAVPITENTGAFWFFHRSPRWRTAAVRAEKAALYTSRREH